MLGALIAAAAFSAQPSPVSMSWHRAGAFVWHTSHVEPAVLGAAMRDAGFGWIAVHVADGTRETSLDAAWLREFRSASGLRVGGWTVLREEPVREAQLAARLVQRYDLDFLVADAEREYAYTNDGVWSAERYARSARFVRTFRRARPALPAAVSSYCRADQHDVDWSAWRAARFVFLPQAYVNDFGAAVAPRTCVWAASRWFPRGVVHPTVGAWAGVRGTVQPYRYARLLADAGTTGFSVYLAENGMNSARWRAYGTLIEQRRIAG